MKLGAVIVAAGLSSRMGEFKPLLRLGDGVLIERTADAFAAAGIDPICIVIGHKGELIRRRLENRGLRFVENARYEQTDMLCSVLLGLRALAAPCERAFIMPADVPLVEPETIRRLSAARGAVVRPMFGGKAGHPLLLDLALLPHLEGYRGAGGLKGAIEAAGCAIEDIAVEDAGILLDADTPADYEKLLQLERSRRGG